MTFGLQFINWLDAFLSASDSQTIPAQQGRPAQAGCPSLAIRDVIQTYRTKDGLSDYTFQFRRLSDGNFNIYILGQPDYGSQSADFALTHRHHDTIGFFICWSQAISDFAEAKDIAAKWAEATELYRKKGLRF